MKTPRFLIIAFVLATPSMVMAQGTPVETQPPQGAEAKQQQIEAKKQTEVKGHVLPIIAGIKSAKMSAAVLHELAVTEPFERRGARGIAELAEQAVRISRERAEHLRDLKGLSAEARTEAEKATKKLKEARSSVERIQRQVGIMEAPLRQNEAESVRNESVRLHAELSDSEKAIEKIADIYQVSTNLDFSEMAPVRQRE